MKEFKKGDRVIFDSKFGYDIGIFVERIDCPLCPNLIELRSGNYQNFQIIVSDDQLFPYSTELVEKLKNKYGYEKSFSNVF